MSAVKAAKQAKKTKKSTSKGKRAVKAAVPGGYQITGQGRLNLTDFASRVGAKPGARFRLEQSRGKSNTWHLVPLD